MTTITLELPNEAVRNAVAEALLDASHGWYGKLHGPQEAPPALRQHYGDIGSALWRLAREVDAVQFSANDDGAK